ncbi:MAG: alpha/beta hydrolase [Clostridiales bacterium]|nr:alpha/beta hydrolase [Clostridiales bacterium]
MKTYRENIWNKDEYKYEAAYGFVPNIVTYLHEEDAALRPCMIVVPGGGYCMVVPPEGEVVAKEFYQRGMNCFVLTYTTDITMSVPLKKQPVNDISRAVRYVRKNAACFGIDPNKIVICGFSAGAHICGTLGVHSSEIEDPDADLNSVSNRPDAMILSYPVITSGEYTHEYSILTLVGKDAPEDERQFFSLEKYVTGTTPPTFIWQTVEDDLVPVENSMMFASACRSAHVPYAYYAFPHGMHGLSVHNDAWRKGDFGEPYTMEQVMKAVEAVREGRGVRVSEQRRQELIEQFGAPPQMPEGEVPKIEDVELWPDLAEAWMKKLWE